MSSRSRASILLAGLSLAVAAPAFAAADHAGPTLLTADQRAVDTVAVALAKDPQIVAARDAVVQAWSALPQAQKPDGKAGLSGAVDEVVYFSVRSAVERKLFAPSVIWAIAAPYASGGLAVPGSRWGIDDPDRIYRSASVDPALRYVIKGKRAAQPSNDDFLFEVTSRDLKTIGSLSARDIDVAANGEFTVSVDANPAAGRRNHLTLPANASGLLIRDTLADWTHQLPNRLTVEVVGGAKPKPGTREEAKADALAQIGDYTQFVSGFIGSVLKAPANQLTPRVRGLELGVEGAIIGMNAFAIQNDEALVLTIDGQGARYVGLEATNLWGRSVRSWDRTGSLSDKQVRASGDGTITYVISPRDPGYYNWLDTEGLNDGFIALRVENFTQVDPARLVKSIRLVKLADLVSAVPADAVRVTAAERAEQQATRKAGYDKRLAH